MKNAPCILSRNIEIMNDSVTDEIIQESFDSALERYQEGVE